MPPASLSIVGRRPPRWVASLCKRGNASLHADVPDVRPHLADSAVVVVPLRIGGGSRLKILEAMAAGRCVLSTSIGADSLSLAGRALVQSRYGWDRISVDMEDAWSSAAARSLSASPARFGTSVAPSSTQQAVSKVPRQGISTECRTARESEKPREAVSRPFSQGMFSGRAELPSFETACQVAKYRRLSPSPIHNSKFIIHNSRPRTITVLHLRDSPFVGGPEKQILGQCARLDRSRFDPLVVSVTPMGSNAFMKAAADLGIRAASVHDGKLALPAAVRQLRALTRQSGACVVISSGFKADLTACLACAAEGIPWIAWFHGHTAATGRVRFYESLDMLALRRAQSTVAVCESAAGQLRGMGLRRVAVVPNAVDVDHIASHGTRQAARNELGLDDDDLVVGTAARLSVEKGLGYLIDAAPAIVAAHPNARFLLIGDGPLRAGLERRAGRLGVASRFIFAGLRADAATLIKAMDVFVLPSLRENMPVALLEAMACGVSVVATDVGGVREVLRGTGVDPIAPGSAPALADAVIARLDSPGIASASLVTRAREFSFDRQVTPMEAAIEQANTSRRKTKG